MCSSDDPLYRCPAVGVGAFDDPHPGALDDPHYARKDAKAHLTEIGKTVEKYLLSGEKISGVTVDRYVIMPNHLHVIFFLDPSRYTQRENGSSRAPTPTNEMLPHVVSTFKRFCNKEIGYPIFQRGYMEHIIRDRRDYEEHLRYIAENPMRWAYDELYSET